MTFAKELREWRKDEPQKCVCDLFGVPLVTYQKWEQGVNEPTDLAKEQIRWRIAAHRSGVTVAFYRERYLSVIKKVAAEIEAIK